MRRASAARPEAGRRHTRNLSPPSRMFMEYGETGHLGPEGASVGRAGRALGGRRAAWAAVCPGGRRSLDAPGARRPRLPRSRTADVRTSQAIRSAAGAPDVRTCPRRPSIDGGGAPDVRTGPRRASIDGGGAPDVRTGPRRAPIDRGGAADVRTGPRRAPIDGGGAADVRTRPAGSLGPGGPASGTLAAARGRAFGSERQMFALPRWRWRRRRQTRPGRRTFAVLGCGEAKRQMFALCGRSGAWPGRQMFAQVRGGRRPTGPQGRRCGSSLLRETDMRPDGRPDSRGHSPSASGAQ